ncbi:hypothetical protein [Variovorax sp. PAMC 28711]|uniref:hypothetical protein n=1 Tax=Variovorax sp. PAMC 28711 TaxID=1795631 RepID=UPI00078DDDC1|nr:hypothetical protein [Variovorax sp. PAMC 28711]AMM25956.1 hypothetical protein AX767_17535 [Variovorax sp. PAMC 28711]
MTVSKILSAIAIAIAVMAATGAAHAETYEGAQAFNSVKSRSEMNAQAVAAASAPNQNVTNGSRVTPLLTSPADRSRINAEATAAAQAPNQNLSRGAFVNSAVPAQYTSQPAPRQAGL